MLLTFLSVCPQIWASQSSSLPSLLDPKTKEISLGEKEAMEAGECRKEGDDVREKPRNSREQTKNKTREDRQNKSEKLRGEREKRM